MEKPCYAPVFAKKRAGKIQEYLLSVLLDFTAYQYTLQGPPGAL